MRGSSGRAHGPAGLAAAAVACLTAIASIGGYACTAAPGEEAVIASVGGDPVTLSEFESYVRAAGEADVPLTGAELKSALLDRLIEERLLLRAAEQEGITVSPAEVDALEAQLAAARPQGANGLAAVDDERHGLDWPEMSRTNLTTHLTLRRLMDQKVLQGLSVSDEEIESYYQENRAFYRRPDAVDVSQILVASAEEAKQIAAELKSNKNEFEELARRKSIGPEGPDGGHLGVFRRGELPPSFDEAIFGLRKGQVSSVVRTDFGYHIFRVNERHPERDLALDEVEDSIRVELLRQKSDKAAEHYLGELERRYPVTIKGDRLDFPYTDQDKVEEQALRGFPANDEVTASQPDSTSFVRPRTER